MRLATAWKRINTPIKAGVLAALLLCATATPALAAPAAHSRADRFAAAAQEFGVPKEVLLAVSYNQSRWISHGSEASADGGYGLMNLRTKLPAAAKDGRGDARRPLRAASSSQADTLDKAATLLKLSPAELKTSETQNIRGAAALLADYARSHGGGALPKDIQGWHDAVGALSGARSTDNAMAFADDVYATIEQGISETTPDGQTLTLPARPGTLHRHATTQSNQEAECPTDLNCRFVPAAHQTHNNNPYDFGNYDVANRPHDMRIKYIVIHDTEGSYQSSIDWFQNPDSYVSGNYIIRSSDGEVTQMVHNKDVSWGAGDWYVNSHAINVEHEGFAAQGGTWYTEAMYRSSAKLVRYLAHKYGIPLDRQHIIGHENVPTTTPASLPGQHTDPGPYWDWNHYMDLLQAPGAHNGPDVSQYSRVLTVAPSFASNQPAIQDCSSGSCVPLPAQGSSLIYLHTAPNASSPLLSDPYKHPDGAAGTNDIADWSAAIHAGAKYAVAGKQGNWTGIWHGGKIGWFYNPSGAQRTAYTSYSRVITPKPGKSSIPVYGVAYPEANAYPADIPAQTLTPLYDLPAGQRYTTSGRTPTDYYYAATIDDSAPSDHTVVRGHDVFYQITFNHKQLYVRADDVNVKFW